LGHTKRYRKVLPTSFRSPYFTEGDIGYFYFKKRRYGSFYLALQTFTRKVFVTRIPNTREASLIAAIAAMKKVLYFMTFFERKKYSQKSVVSAKPAKLLWQVLFNFNKNHCRFKRILLKLLILSGLPFPQKIHKPKYV